MKVMHKSSNSEYSAPLVSRGVFLIQIFLNKYIYDKKTYILILISFLPLLTLGSIDNPRIDDFVDLIGPDSIMGFLIMPLVSLILGVSAISDEKENKTISQLLSRPVRREEILLSKWITIMIIGLIITFINSIVLYFGFYLLLPGSIDLFGNFFVFLGVYLSLGLWYVVYATIFLFVGVFLDKNAIGLGLAIAYFEAFFSQFLFGSATEKSPFSIANHIYYITSEYLLNDYISFKIANFESFSSVLVCIGLIMGFLALSAFTIRRKDFP